MTDHPVARIFVDLSSDNMGLRGEEIEAIVKELADSHQWPDSRFYREDRCDARQYGFPRDVTARYEHRLLFAMGMNCANEERALMVSPAGWRVRIDGRHDDGWFSTEGVYHAVFVESYLRIPERRMLQSHAHKETIYTVVEFAEALRHKAGVLHGQQRRKRG